MDSRLHRQIIVALREAGDAGLTDRELTEAVGGVRWSIGARRHELVESGEVTDSGQVRTTTSGRPEKVWILAATGHVLRLIVMHVAGCLVETRSGGRFRLCRFCGASLPPDFPEGETIFERDDTFTATRPPGIQFASCKRARRAARARP